ncbi:MULTISPECIES: 3-isopropylmalate dehydratase small subunit [Burkholderiaceae]|uniref:3-isopropylmalate dehydratase small subunit n=1 Tax=Burkholderiaceae TaxID=119060 RepID=UPI0014248879|nr:MULTISPECIES: 3-isopropylmalate dehydratase small subunit [Burkholderiaceae]MBN3848943.1 3-isopropylmalate dehydratase small subunit [Paraburkholderia sp. Ac-20342]NIF54686.1 3-isopropylmalate dehydratase small subunit [Burkholderia sp. Ax-1724]
MPDFSRMEGVAAPLPIANLDTDQIMPKQFLLGTDKSGLAAGLLYDLRFLPDGSRRDDFVLNTPAYAGAKVLVGGANFGCGSSREHAVWGLLQSGIEAVLAPSYGEIFYYNAANNRLLAIILKPEEIDEISAEISNPAANRLSIDVAAQTVRTASGRTYSFRMDERHRQMFLEGLDVLGASLKMLPHIEAFEARHRAENPWAHVLPLPAGAA